MSAAVASRMRGCFVFSKQI